MDAIKATRELGKALQSDQRFIEYAKNKLAIDKDEALQNMVGEFNIQRMNIERMSAEENRDDEKFKEANLKLREIYDTIMANETMKAFNDSKEKLDKLMNDIFSIIQMCSEGADPDTCEIPEGGCSGNCGSCGGCH